MTTALAWLAPPAPPPLTRVEVEEHGVRGLGYDGLLAPTPGGAAVAVDLLRCADGRAAMLRGLLPPGAAVARASAVWVHTGRLCPRRTEVLVRPGVRVQAAVVVHRQHLTAADVVVIGGVGVTTPLRTAVDLLCFGEEAGAVAGTKALLSRGLAAAAVREALHRPRRRVPARRALALLERAERPGRWP